MPYCARVSATRAVAVRRSRFRAIASRTSACSTGSRTTPHHGTSAIDSACASPVTNRCAGGAGTSGRLYRGPTMHPPAASTTAATATGPAGVKRARRLIGAALG